MHQREGNATSCSEGSKQGGCFFGGRGGQGVNPIGKGKGVGVAGKGQCRPDVGVEGLFADANPWSSFDLFLFFIL